MASPEPDPTLEQGKSVRREERQRQSVRNGAQAPFPIPPCRLRGGGRGVGRVGCRMNSARSLDQGSLQATPARYRQSHHLPGLAFVEKGSGKKLSWDDPFCSTLEAMNSAVSRKKAQSELE